MSAADHPSRYQPPHHTLGPLHPAVAEAIAKHEAPDLIAGIEFLLSLTSPEVRARWCDQAPWKEGT